MIRSMLISFHREDITQVQTNLVSRTTPKFHLNPNADFINIDLVVKQSWVINFNEATNAAPRYYNKIIIDLAVSMKGIYSGLWFL